MKLDHEACYRALSTRDARFDGRMFIAVRTTGVYCRPICPARTPNRENVMFYPTASSAQEAGFRPCLRCRPESSPDLAAWRGTSNTVSRALALIAESALDREAVDGSIRYRRSIALDGAQGAISVEPDERERGLRVTIRFPRIASLARIVRRVRRVFDLSADPLAIGEDLARDPLLAPLVARRPGLRVPGAWDGFEVAVRAMLGH